MNRIKIIGLALVAMFAIGAVASATASAVEPEWNIVKEVTNRKLTAANQAGVKSILESNNLLKTKVECTTNKTTAGEVGATGTKTVSGVKILFTGCTSALGGCKSAGKMAGEIETATLSGEIGYLVKPTKVGVDLTNAVALANFECGGTAIEVTGSVIGEITPLKTVIKHTGAAFVLTYEEKEGKQKFTKFEGGATDVLFAKIGTAAPVESGQSAKDEAKPEVEGTEIKIEG